MIPQIVGTFKSKTQVSDNGPVRPLPRRWIACITQWGTFVGIDRNLKARLWHYCHAYNRQHRTETMHVGPITRAAQSCLRALIWLAGSPRGGSWSYETVAREANVGRDTVRQAITVLRAAGIIKWSNHWRWNERAGRVTKSLNSYELCDPTGPYGPTDANVSVDHKAEIHSAPREQEDLSGACASYIGKVRASTSGDGARLESAIARLMALRPGG